MIIPNDLCMMLQEVSETQDRNGLLAAADLAQEYNFHSLYWLLEYFGSSKTKEWSWIFTGSRKYGTPKPDSDFDWVVFLGHYFQDDWLSQKADSHTRDTVGETSAFGIDYACRFGPLNVLVVSTTKQYRAWDRGTKNLFKRRPVTREEAVEEFRRQFRRHSLNTRLSYAY